MKPGDDDAGAVRREHFLAPALPQGYEPRPRKVDVRLPGKGKSNSRGARPDHLIITMIKWTRTSRLSIKKSLSRRSWKRSGRTRTRTSSSATLTTASTVSIPTPNGLFTSCRCRFAVQICQLWDTLTTASTVRPFLATLLSFLATLLSFLDTSFFPRHTISLPRHTIFLPRYAISFLDTPFPGRDRALRGH